MASVAEARRSPFSGDPHHPNLHKSIPILPSSSPRLAASRDPMDITPSSSTMGPPNERTQSVSFQLPSQREGNGDSENTSPPNGNTAPAVGAAAAAQQPKVVQTAFIHKLYNMLEDQSIQHLISWASTNESFVMSPSSEFSKVLSSYFKHTNISSFVRQLNMYGFHKVSDVFHTGSPDTPLWEFKHGNGNFKRGDLVGLREIKRRASRHALVHRESFPAPKMPLGPPAGQAVDPMPDPVESRLQSLEYNLHDMHARMQRSEDTCAYLTQRSSVLAEGMMKCHQWNQDLANLIMQMVPDPENPIHRDVAMMQREIARQTDMLRALEPPEDAPLSARQSYFMQVDSSNGPPLSPRQMPQDNLTESRRGSLANVSRQAPYKAPIPAHLAISPRRYGSIGTGNYSPSSARTPVSHQPPPPPPPQVQQPGGANLGSNLPSTLSPPYNLYRRHTSADIRLHGWQPQPPNPAINSPYASGYNSTQWPSSPRHPPIGGGDQQLRDALESYQLPRGPRQAQSRHGSPPPPNENMPSTLNPDAGWTLPGARYPFKGLDTGPPTRRSSMASNVHSLLNPAETAERSEEDEADDVRKRKRMQ
ncbi:uncharacterized protein J4E92_010781 [Alternaria infectoria]|uniref:uncharacterized protein n=1 Tax=Alternaria infectoria TaxID=45303 RepID=UPI00221F1270|nr:uncharacterized protein J4E92_010781 [Alternaria infectoria]KAI4908588.1 hypothetical protein J4E92_010781 [Alternaria infectoria]